MRLEHWLYKLPLILRSLFHHRQVEAELQEELQYHLEMKTDEFVARGMPSEEARCAALRTMDGLEFRKEQCRDARGIRWLDELMQDTIYAFRALRRTPGFTAAAVITLAVGIGANTSVFSVVNAVLLRSLPYPKPHEIVKLQTDSPKHGLNPMFAFSEVQAFINQSRTLKSIAAYEIREGNFSASGEADRVSIASASPGIFQLLVSSLVSSHTTAA